MTTTPLPAEREVRRRLARVDSLVSIPGLAVISAYLIATLDLSRAEWARFAAASLLFGLGSTVVSEFLRRRSQRDLRRVLSIAGTGGTPDDRDLHAAFANALRIPVSMTGVMLGVWVSASVLVPLLTAALGDAEWLSPERLGAVAVASLCGGCFSAGFIYFGAKRSLADVREALGVRIPDAEVRAALVRPIPLARKLQLAVAGCSGTSLVFAMGLAWSSATAGLDGLALRWQADVLQSIAERWAGSEEVPLEDVVLSVVPDTALLPHPIDFAILGSGDAPAPEGLRAEEITARVADGEAAGGLARSGLERLQSWRRLPDGRVLVASTPRSALHETLDGIGLAMGTVLLLAVALSLGVGRVLASDVSQATEALRHEVERVAEGDLREGAVLESDDEIGDLARSFGRMGAALRAMVRRVAEAADRVEATAAEMASISQSVGVASADQVRRIQQATELMAAIKGQVEGVSGSAQALNVSIEESSSSILELGAAGDELNETASILSSKVDEVSTSIEQMVRSVGQVGESSESLSDIAAETSSSMEEMASAMRAVDTTAARAAELSRDVVSSAEAGQEKVRQTIESMEAIRDATDASESVIRGLGSRAREIGAILDVIDDVADETNLLALNAAIIAAQAGEHGRAFSVVAEEIKALAERVLSSTKEIGGLIRSVQDETANVTGAIEEGSRSVATGVELSAAAGVSLEGITRSSRDSGERMTEIVQAVREQTKAAAHVAELMERVRDGVEQIRAAGVEQGRGNEIVNRSSLTMRDVAQQVRRTTEEQARGFVRIRESVEGVRLAVEQINGSLREQSEACNQVAAFLDQVYERTRANEDAGQRMGDAMRGMLGQAEMLRDDVKKFRI